MSTQICVSQSQAPNWQPPSFKYSNMYLSSDLLRAVTKLVLWWDFVVLRWIQSETIVGMGCGELGTTYNIWTQRDCRMRVICLVRVSNSCCEKLFVFQALSVMMAGVFDWVLYDQIIFSYSCTMFSAMCHPLNCLQASMTDFML